MIIFIYVFIFGAVFGSFLNVVIYRVPNKKSIIFPNSQCTTCGTSINWYDNIPIISYIFLLGKCRNCKEKISLIYPFVELLTGAAFVLVYWKYGFEILALKYIIFAILLIVLAFIDLKTYLLPDIFTGALIITGILFALFLDVKPEKAFLGAAAFNFPYLILFAYGKVIFKKEAMGFGDVKLTIGIGMYLGYQSFMYFYNFFMMSFILGSVFGVIMLLQKKKKTKDMIPFGPFIALAAFIMSILY